MIAVTAAVLQTAPAGGPDACELLTPEEVRSVQDVPVTERKNSSDVARSLRFAQCVLATTDVSRSVAVTVITGATSGADGAWAYWQKTFHPQRSAAALAAATRNEALLRPLPGIGEEAFWTGDRRAGALSTSLLMGSCFA